VKKGALGDLGQKENVSGAIHNQKLWQRLCIQENEDYNPKFLTLRQGLLTVCSHNMAI
jgi:hypothetical protein